MPRKSSARDSNKKSPKKTSALHKEVVNLSVAAVGILLLLANIGVLGPVGTFLSGFLFGLFGLGAFILPIAVITIAVCNLIAGDIKMPVFKIIALFWLILSLLHIFLYKPTEDTNIFVDVYTAWTNEDKATCGGVFGMLIGFPVKALFHTLGATILIITLIVILLVLITKRSFVQILGKGVEKARDYYEETKYYGDYEEEGNVIHVDTGYRPPRKAKSEKKKSNIVTIEETEQPPPETKILLFSEERDLKKREKQAASPLFAPRSIELAEKPRKKADVSFPETFVIRGEPQINAYEPHQDYENEYYENPENFEYEENENYEEIEDFEDEPVILPVSQDNSDYGEGLVVKGLVEGAEKSPDPLFADDEDLMQYDEYANASGVKTANTTSIPAMTQIFENYVMPSLNLLAKNERPAMSAESRTHVLENSRILEETLRSFKIESKVVEVSVGPTVTRYDLAPGAGVKVSSIVNLSNDLALSLAAQGLRIEAPVPGKSAVGIEIPNKEPQGVFLREILDDERFLNYPSKLAFAVGKDIAGSAVITDIARMPHLLIAGATGSGKSVCINTLIASLLYKARPDEVKLLMIDPKVVELSVYNGIPHLLIPVVTDPKKASGALSWAVSEMETRYNLFAETGCRDLKGYNKVIKERGEQEVPLIVIIIDELADLMMTCKGEVEESICRLAQKARAAGIHLVVATQRPSVDVITGLIKANIPSRLAFAVSSGTDSRTVLDMYGAEKLLGKGDMLFLPMGQNKPLRVQGGFISDKEVENLVAFLKAQAPVVHSVEEIQKVTMPGKVVIDGDVDEFFHDAVEFLISKGKGSTSMLQRQFRIGYNRASRLMDDLQKRGIVGPEDGVKPRKVTITREEYNELYG